MKKAAWNKRCSHRSHAFNDYYKTFGSMNAQNVTLLIAKDALGHAHTITFDKIGIDHIHTLHAMGRNIDKRIHLRIRNDGRHRSTRRTIRPHRDHRRAIDRKYVIVRSLQENKRGNDRHVFHSTIIVVNIDILFTPHSHIRAPTIIM